MPQRPPARLTQRRYFDDHEVKRRAPAKGVSWIPPLGLPRTDGPLEPPALDDLADDAGDAAATVRATTPDAGPALDEAATSVDELGSYDEAEAFMASVVG